MRKPYNPARRGGVHENPLFVLLLYAGIVVADVRVPLVRLLNLGLLFSSLLAFVIAYWGVFLAPPLLAVIYAHKRHLEQKISRTT